MVNWCKVKLGDHERIQHKTMCFVCNEVINIESMGESALKSHMKETLELDIDSLVK